MRASLLVLITTLHTLFSAVACFEASAQPRSLVSLPLSLPPPRTRIVNLQQSSTDVSEATSSATTLSGPPALTARDLTCSFDGGDTYQLNRASYVLPRASRVGLVGRNGCGKSTFLRILAAASGTDTTKARENFPYTGHVECPKDVTVSFVEQEPPSPSDITVSDALLGVTDLTKQQQSTNARGGSKSTNKADLNKVYRVVRDYRLASLNAATDPEGFANAAAAMDANNGWSVLTKAEEISTRLRVRNLEDQPLSSLSGGERKRVALAAALVKDPDVLICDEPTNHLDLAAIEWLSNLINEKKKMTFLTVTHDRAFLEDVCNTILELDRGKFYTHEGTYANYLYEKEERLANEDQAYREGKAKLKKELEWMRRQPQGRQTKQNARQEAYFKLERSTKPRVKDPKLELADDGQRRLGGNILKMRDVSLSFGDNKMLSDFSYDFNKGDRIGIVGRNGVGKSTFIRMLTGDQPADAGTITPGETVMFGTYDQMGIPFLDENQSVLDFVKERVESSSGASLAEAPQEAMKLLKQFQFQRSRWNERVSMLSGGEQRRLQLLSVLTKRPNFLILDEPTNDIDLDTVSALEAYLDDYKGVLVIVSHDRSFTDHVTDHLFVFEGNGVVKDYLGSLSEYSECLIAQEKEGISDETATISNTNKSSYKENKAKRLERRNTIKKMKKELSKIESGIEKLKAKAEGLQIKIDNSEDEGWTVLADLTEKLQTINDEIETKELHWLEIAESLETLEEESV